MYGRQKCPFVFFLVHRDRRSKARQAKKQNQKTATTLFVAVVVARRDPAIVIEEIKRKSPG